MISRNIRLFYWFNFFTDFRLYAPIAIIYFAQVTGSYALGMSIFSITMVSSALFEIPTGVLSDRMGRRKTLIAGALAAVGYSLFYAIGQSFWILVIGAIFEGLSRSFYSGNNNAMLHDTITQMGKPDEYDEHLGKTSSMFQVALGSAALLGGVLATWSFPLIMWLSVIPQIMCVLIALRMIEPRIHDSEIETNLYSHLKEAIAGFLKNSKLRLLSLSSIAAFGYGEASYQFQSAFYSMLWPVWAIGFVRFFSNAAATLSFWYSGKLIRKYQPTWILLVSNIYSRTVGILATVFPTNFSPAILSSTSLLFGVSSVARSSLMQNTFSPKQRATMGSLDSFAGSIFFGIVATILGVVADILTPAKALLYMQIAMLPTLYLYWSILKKK